MGIENLPHVLPSIVNNFNMTGSFSEAKPFGSGHIHESYLISTKEKKAPDYVLQKINQHVFQDVPGLMKNIESVINHIRGKMSRVPNASPERKCLHLIFTIDQNSCYQDEAGFYWRVYRYIENSRSYDIAPGRDVIYEAGKAFGKFQALLADLSPNILFETLPDFHNIKKRLQDFFATVAQEPEGRARMCQAEIAEVARRADEMRFIDRLGRAGKIPLRVTHNDTKLNNVLFDQSGKALCVIDLDTVMPGYIHYDFGDAIRTCSNTGAEDELDLTKVTLDLELFEAFARGFLEQTHNILTSTEIETLAFSAKLMTFVIGLRFLTDYLDGDRYYKTRFAEHNLQRARTQFKLLSSMEERYDEMQTIIQNIVRAGQT